MPRKSKVIAVPIGQPEGISTAVSGDEVKQTLS